MPRGIRYAQSACSISKSIRRKGMFDGEHYNDGSSPNRVYVMEGQGKLNTKHHGEEKKSVYCLL